MKDHDIWVAIQRDSSQAISKFCPRFFFLFQHSPWILCKVGWYCALGCIKTQAETPQGNVPSRSSGFLATLREFLVTSLWQIYSSSAALTAQSVQWLHQGQSNRESSFDCLLVKDILLYSKISRPHLAHRQRSTQRIPVAIYHV